ncbi:MAG TPA: ABC transporter permease [Acidobacteriota bacterium]|nr:ABC transporter permease [Acidobacteriota bacterium]
MQNVLAIWQREMKSYFVSPIAYVVLTVFLFLSGFFFYSILTAVVQSTMMQGQFGQGAQSVDVPGIVSRSFFGTMSVILLFMIPMLTMGLFAEERKRGTIELLLTTPVGTFQAMMGKYLACVTFLVIMFFSSGITMSALFIYGHPELKPILGAFLGLLLYGCALLAVGLFISTLTENQIIAVVITFGVILVLWLIESFSTGASGVSKDILNYLSVIGHLDDFIKGVIDTSHVIFYLTFAFVGLFLTYRSLESMRWKG